MKDVFSSWDRAMYGKILFYLYFRGCATREELAKALETRPQTITSLTWRLRQKGFADIVPFNPPFRLIPFKVCLSKEARDRLDILRYKAEREAEREKINPNEVIPRNKSRTY